MSGKKRSIKRGRLKNKKNKVRIKNVRIYEGGEPMEESDQRVSEKRQHGSIHHIFPTSRGGPKNNHDNKYTWPGITPKNREAKHRAWHQLFYNLLPSEAIKMILGWVTTSGELNKEKVGDNNLEAWKIAFDNVGPYDAMVFIIEKFIPVETECFKNNCFKKERFSLGKRGRARKDPVETEKK